MFQPPVGLDVWLTAMSMWFCCVNAPFGSDSSVSTTTKNRWVAAS